MTFSFATSLNKAEKTVVYFLSIQEYNFGMAQHRSNDVDTFIDKVYKSDFDITSMWTGVVEDGEVTEYHRHKTPYDEDGSITDNITEYLTDIPEILVDLDPTIDELLSHSSGIGTTTQAITLLERNAEIKNHSVDMDSQESFYDFVERNSYTTGNNQFFYSNTRPSRYTID